MKSIIHKFDFKMKKGAILFVFAITIAFLSEIFLYNYGYWKTLGNNSITEYNINYGQGICIKEDGNIVLSPTRESLYVEITDINKPVTCLEFDAVWSDEAQKDEDVNYRIYAIDEGNAFYLQLPDVFVNQLISGSKYCMLHLAGNVKSLKIEILPQQIGENGIELKVNHISLNPRREFHFSFFRMILLCIIFIILLGILPIWGLWNIHANDKSIAQAIITGMIVCAEIALAVILINKVEYSIYNVPYIEMAKALSKGQVYLDREASESLLGLANPYDTSLRNHYNVDFSWDYAYYKGRYYVYFGVVPDVLFFLPYLLITGKDYTGYGDNLFPIIGVIIGIAFLTRKVIKKFYPKMSFMLSQYLMVAMTFGSYIYICATHPDYYSVPRTWSVCFLVWGIYFWISSVREGHISKVEVAIGSLCMALIAGCRPQLLLGMLLAIPIFYDYVLLEINNGKKAQLVKNAVVFSAPIAIVAVLLMYYNYARFGSPFDFGANYNLTSNDMTKRGFDTARIPQGLFGFLFQLPIIKMSFPFLTKVSLPDTAYQGVNIFSQTAGGFFPCNLLAFAGFGVFSRKVEQKNKWAGIICFVSVFVIAAVDSMMAGVLPYYDTDFGLFGMMAAFLVIANLEKKDNDNKRLYQIVAILSIILCLYHIFSIFGFTNIRNGAPRLYNYVREFMEPWRY